MLTMMKKVDQKLIDKLNAQFDAMDADGNGYLEVSDHTSDEPREKKWLQTAKLIPLNSFGAAGGPRNYHQEQAQGQAQRNHAIPHGQHRLN